MRWSLILSVFVAVQSVLSFLCAALPVSPSLDGLEKRARASGDPAKIPSKAYRESSKLHPDAYHVQGLGPTGQLTAETKVTKKTLKEGERHRYGHELLTSADGNKLHADHVFEVQMLHHHLKDKGLPQFKDLKGNLQKELRNILNGPKNMAIIPASINQSKGQLIKHGMENKKINRNKGRDEYALKSYGTAHKIAGELDQTLKEHGYDLGKANLQNKLHTTFVAAGLPPGSSTPPRHSSPASSRSSPPNQGQSNSKQSNPRPSTPGPSRPATPGPSRQSNPGPSSSSPNRGYSGKRNASPGNSPPKTRQRTGNSPPKTRRRTRKK